MENVVGGAVHQGLDVGSLRFSIFHLSFTNRHSSFAVAGGPMTLMQEMNRKALELGVPLSAHIDLTFRCNERCIHCYLDHEDYGEMNTAEIKDVLDQLSE